jgi:hypothetical protein
MIYEDETPNAFIDEEEPTDDEEKTEEEVVE